MICITARYSIKGNGIHTVVNATDNATPTPIQNTGEPLQRLCVKLSYKGKLTAAYTEKQVEKLTSMMTWEAWEAGSQYQ
jgi:hypothetical protein